MEWKAMIGKTGTSCIGLIIIILELPISSYRYSKNAFYDDDNLLLLEFSWDGYQVPVPIAYNNHASRCTKNCF